MNNLLGNNEIFKSVDQLTSSHAGLIRCKFSHALDVEITQIIDASAPYLFLTYRFLLEYVKA